MADTQIKLNQIQPSGASAGNFAIFDGTDWIASSSAIDNNFFIVDNLDNTKKATFQISGITTATTRTYTFPDATGILALTTGTGGANRVTFWNDNNTITSASTLLTNGTNVAINTSITTSYLLKAKQTTTGDGILIERSSDTRGIAIYNDGTATIESLNSGNLLLKSAASTTITFSTGGGSGQTSQLSFAPTASVTAVNANSNMFNIGGTYAPTTSGGSFHGVTVAYTVNQTGTADQLTSGIHINPTLTSVASAGFKGVHYAPSTQTFLYQPSGTSVINHLVGNIGVGTGTTNPSAKIDVVGNGATSATYGLKVQNSSGTNNALVVRDDGRVGILTATPNQPLEVSGAVRITGSNGTPTALLGRDANGDLANLTLGSGLSISSGQLTLSGGNGIYGGSGTVASAAVATLTNSLTFDYAGGVDALKIDGTTGLGFRSPDNTVSLTLDNNGLSFNETGISLTAASSTRRFTFFTTNTVSTFLTIDPAYFQIGSPYISLYHDDDTLGVEVRFQEGVNNGAHYTAIRSPNALAANLTYVLPTTATDGYFLKYNSSGNQLEWAAAGNGIYGGSGTVASAAVATLTNSLTFDYSGGVDALKLDGTTGATIKSPDNTVSLIIDNSGFSFSDSGLTFSISSSLRRYTMTATNTLSSTFQLDSTYSYISSPYFGIYGNNSAVAGELRLYEASTNGSNYTTIRSPLNLASNLTYVLPTGATDGTFLKYNSSGNQLEWATVSSGGNGIYGGSGNIATAAVATVGSGSSFTIDYNSSLPAVNVVDNLGVTISSDNGNNYLGVEDGFIGAYTTNSSLEMTDTSAAFGFNSYGLLVDTNAFMMTAPYVGIKNSTTVGGSIRFFEGTTNGTNYMSIKAPDSISSNIDYILPTGATNGNFLKYNTGGQLEWAAVSSGGNGIYGGSGTIASAAVATLTSSSTFTIDYSTTIDAFRIDDSNGSIRLAQSNGLINVTINSAGVNINGGSTGAVRIDDGSVVLAPIDTYSPSASQNNYAISEGTNRVRLNPSTNIDITGISQTLATSGTFLILHNVSGIYNVTLKNESVNSTAANRISLGANELSDVVLRPQESYTLIYDGTSSRWRSWTSPTIPTSVQITASPVVNTTATGITTTFTANENQGFGDVVFINVDGEAQLADADFTTTMPAVAMCIGTVTANNVGNYLLYGIARNDSWNWTVGGYIYVSTTGTTTNTLTQTAPSGTGDVVQIVGIATHADRILFKPDLTTIEL